MKQNIEIEYKVIVSKEKFNAFLADAPITEEIYQTNFYYDTEDYQLYQAGVTLRIRQIEDSYYFTLKERARHHSVEHEVMVSENSLSVLATPTIANLLKKFNLTLPIQLVGELSTCRKIYHDQYGEWCFDQNFYSNTEDYEIEYELHEGITDAFKHFLTVLRKYKIRYKKAPGKRYRCLFSHKSDN